MATDHPAAALDDIICSLARDVDRVAGVLALLRRSTNARFRRRSHHRASYPWRGASSTDRLALGCGACVGAVTSGGCGVLRADDRGEGHSLGAEPRQDLRLYGPSGRSFSELRASRRVDQ